MNKILPNKWIRKAISDAISGLVVDSKEIKCYDSRTGLDSPREYVVMTTQTAEVVKETKCEYQWRSSILLDVTVRRNDVGNQGSRVFSDDLTDAVKNAVSDLELDPLSGLKIITQSMSFPSDLVTTTTSEVVMRKFIRIELLIN